MTTYVALLRGINLGPKRKVPMAALRQTLEDAGYGDVRTYIQSGNVVLTSLKTAKTVGPHIEQLIEESTGLVVPVVLRTAARVLHAIGYSPIVPEHYILADRNFVLDISAARKELGWSPRYDNVRMMIDAYEWYVNEGESAWPRMHPLVRLLNRLAPIGRPSA